MLLEIICGVASVLAMMVCVAMHVGVLELIIKVVCPWQRGLWALLIGVPMLVISHIAHVAVYALFISLLYTWQGEAIGTLSGDFYSDGLSLWYFSATTFTTVGFGDIAPLGPIRVFIGIESIAGLVLITWSASFTFLGMQNSWIDRHDRLKSIASPPEAQTSPTD